MSSELRKCEDLALKLHPKDRAALAQQLIASLDSLDSTENEDLWLEEADRRYQEYTRGNVSSRPADEVLRDARASMK